MKIDRKEAFIQALEQLYGDYQYESALFGTHNYTTISSNLCYSKSHFTKLISGSATDAMYDRALENINKLKRLSELEDLHSKAKIEIPNSEGKIWKYLSFILLALTALSTYGYFNVDGFSQTNKDDLAPVSDHPLNMYFDFNDAHYYKSPYLTEEQVHEYCPCSAFEGRWQLSDEYIIPIPYKIPGLYYVGKKADIRLKCRKTNSSSKGHDLIGFENIENEIWFDKSKSPIDVEGDINEANKISEYLNTLNFSQDDNFIKIANVYSCFYDEIKITSDSIYRLGEPCGRYANGIDENILKEFNLDLNHIIEYIIGNMIFAQCDPIKNQYNDPNELVNGESLLEFPCKCYSKNENLGLGGAYSYNKTIQLMQQNYQSNLFCAEKNNTN